MKVEKKRTAESTTLPALRENDVVIVIVALDAVRGEIELGSFW